MKKSFQKIVTASNLREFVLAIESDMDVVLNTATDEEFIDLGLEDVVHRIIVGDVELAVKDFMYDYGAVLFAPSTFLIARDGLLGVVRN